MYTKAADIIVSATGIQNLITADMVSEGVAVIDVGLTQILDEKTGRRRLVGDVDFKGCSRWLHISEINFFFVNIVLLSRPSYYSQHRMHCFELKKKYVIKKRKLETESTEIRNEPNMQVALLFCSVIDNC